MVAKLSSELGDAVQQQQGKPLYVVDERTQTQWVLLSADTFQRVAALVGSDEFDPIQMMPLAHEALQEAWDAPGMELYDDYDAHKSTSS